MMLSTVAWSAYNALAIFCDEPADAHVIGALLRAKWTPAIKDQTVLEALDALVERRLIQKDNGLYFLPIPRAAIHRDRGGDGWSGWQFEEQPGTLRAKLESNQIATVGVETVIARNP